MTKICVYLYRVKYLYNFFESRIGGEIMCLIEDEKIVIEKNFKMIGQKFEGLSYEEIINVYLDYVNETTSRYEEIAGAIKKINKLLNKEHNRIVLEKDISIVNKLEDVFTIINTIIKEIRQYEINDAFISIRERITNEKEDLKEHLSDLKQALRLADEEEMKELIKLAAIK